MQRELITQDGLCRASVRTEEQVAEIRAALDATTWLPRTFRWLEAVRDPTRFKIVYLLRHHGPLCVCDLANILGVTSSAVSQHLRKLKDMDLATATRSGQTMFYFLRTAEFLELFDRIPPPHAQVAA